MLAVVDPRDNISGIVGFLLCVADAIHAWASFGRTSTPLMVDAVAVTPRSGRDFL
ncbi:hypothetical protein ACGFYZ_37055 [Streptomyces sp. NPDC048330]|uniref:hypothetical protein n=1 Tax=Streptomyces sp. NPDC048330 TaxID=3365533 RepID=UPI0037198798